MKRNKEVPEIEKKEIETASKQLNESVRERKKI
jgi:hypothetical protein